jgi:hypothetical protein
MLIINKLYKIIKYTYNKIHNIYEYFSPNKHKLINDEYEIVNDILKHY